MSLTSTLSPQPFAFSYDWAALEGIAVESGLSPDSSACVPQPEGGFRGSDSEPHLQNPSISNHFKPNQTEGAEASDPDPSCICGSPFLGGNNPKKRRRTGKVAQLPHAIREQINILLDDGQTYREIVHWLNAHGHPGFNQENISNWAQGGFQDWLNHRDKLDQAKILAQYARELVEQCPGTTFQEASQALIEMNFFDLLNRFDPEPLHKLLQDKPEFFFRLISSMTAFNRGKLAKDKFKWQQAQAEKKDAAKREGVGFRVPIHRSSTFTTFHVARAPAIVPNPREGATSTSTQTPDAVEAFPTIEQNPFDRTTNPEIQPLNFYFHPDSLPTTIIADTPMTVPHSFIYKPWEGASSTSALILDLTGPCPTHPDLSMPPEATPIDLSTPESNVSQFSNRVAWG